MKSNFFGNSILLFRVIRDWLRKQDECIWYYCYGRLAVGPHFFVPVQYTILFLYFITTRVLGQKKKLKCLKEYEHNLFVLDFITIFWSNWTYDLIKNWDKKILNIFQYVAILENQLKLCKMLRDIFYLHIPNKFYHIFYTRIHVCSTKTYKEVHKNS